MADHNKFDEIARLLETEYPATISGPVEEATIREAERELQVRFPRSYVWFLERLGAAGFPFEIYGLSPDTDGGAYWNIVYIAEAERSEVLSPLPPELIPIGPNGSGDHWCLDTGSIRPIEQECNVVFWNHAVIDQIPVVTHPTFLDWFENRVKTSIED